MQCRVELCSAVRGRKLWVGRSDTIHLWRLDIEFLAVHGPDRNHPVKRCELDAKSTAARLQRSRRALLFRAMTNLNARFILAGRFCANWDILGQCHQQSP